VEFEGFTWPERFLVASTPVDYAPHGYAMNAYVADPENWSAIFKMPDEGPPGLWRVIFPVPPEEEESATLSEDNVERLMQGFLPMAGRYPIKYKSIYKVHQRVAKNFRDGRVLLAGDAAHLNNPMGAFGLNGGIHDSINLSEKLAKVCRGEADQSLLDLYVRQRRTVNLEYVQEHSIRNLNRLIAKSLPRTVIVMDWFSLDQDSNFNIRITVDTHCVSQILPMGLGFREWWCLCHRNIDVDEGKTESRRGNWVFMLMLPHCCLLQVLVLNWRQIEGRG
jgi:2-polyprenyl-6-methoxyphenol hydroxylase-like FAD-dependent oxidoreductase